MMRDFLRSLPVFAGLIPEFDADALPADPAELFGQWLRSAVDDGVAEPHAMTVSTSDAAGAPDARVLILKDLDAQGWWFATDSNGVKGVQLAARPVAALTFYWPAVARQVRVRGAVKTGSMQTSEADFRSRGTTARAVALASHSSEPLDNRLIREAAVAEAERQLSANPGLVSPSWCVYVVLADTVEFWQADKDRQHTRVRYRRDRDEWSHTLLWP
jgi:pyridoxamine 5'-phosphate oxidase